MGTLYRGHEPARKTRIVCVVSSNRFVIQTFWIAIAWLLGLLLHSSFWGLLIIPVTAMLAVTQTFRNPRLLRTIIVAGMIGCVGWGYANIRQPTPSFQDISLQAPQPNITLSAVVDTLPRITRSQNNSVWLSAQQYSSSDNTFAPTTGKLYATYSADDSIPPLQPGQTVELTGYLYRPSSVKNPGGFDFRSYLASKGAFAGFRVDRIAVINSSTRWGGWVLRTKVLKTFRRGLGDRRGTLLGSMVLGSAASQLPVDLQDSFRTVGLAHVTAASGFHVALLLGLVLWLSAGLGQRTQLWVAISTLGLYLVMTGGSPSAIRATVMGGTVLLAKHLNSRNPTIRSRTVHPVGLLLATAVVMTIFQPLWIENAGFQLSFAATFGLIVSSLPIQKRLDFIPPNLATAISTPLAALLWTLPLQLAIFGKVSSYVLIASLLTAPFVTLSIGGGLIVAVVSLIIPPLASLLVWPLRFLLDPLIGFVAWIATWPSALIHTRTVSVVQCVALYALLVMLTFSHRLFPRALGISRFRSRQNIGLGLTGAFLVLVAIPAMWPAPAIQIVTLATSDDPVIVVRSAGQTGVINSGSLDSVEFNVLPYLRSQGIRTIDLAIALVPSRSIAGWERLAQSMPIREFWAGESFAVRDSTAMLISQLQTSGSEARRLKSGETLSVGRLHLQAIDEKALTFTSKSGAGLIAGAPLSELEEFHNHGLVPSSIDWLWWDGTEMPPRMMEWLHPNVGVVGGNHLNAETQLVFERAGSTLLWTDEVGATIWTPEGLTSPYGPEN